jgi:antitoxin MazE
MPSAIDPMKRSVYYVDTFGSSIMESVIRKWGNSPALRLPALVLKEAALSVDQKVTIMVSDGHIVIRPSEQVEYKLDDLLAGITPKNTHTEISFGKPVGKEAF